ncbi:HAD family hydrolase [Haladaptatus pallidirubidus]|uniref:HAD family hydrolase n=1 Tax=Haladaptatus pallidirubidus TaxID=1008152 RepID=UPI001D114FB8|nr:HAD hydrolase-like protein [Haladaptatus pallidirubidus]
MNSVFFARRAARKHLCRILVAYEHGYFVRRHRVRSRRDVGAARRGLAGDGRGNQTDTRRTRRNSERERRAGLGADCRGDRRDGGHRIPHRCGGARRGAQLRTVTGYGQLVKANVPVGICSLNCEAACREALDAHGISKEIGAIVGRNSVENRKPHPEPLLTAVGRLGTEPEKTLFVRDSDSDAETARRAGTAFRRV